MSVDIKKLCISERGIQKRLNYIRAQIEKCEGGIPSKLWCDDCKNRIKKIKRLLDKLQMAKERQYPSYITYSDVNASSDKIFNSYDPRYVCLDCKANLPETYRIYERKEDLVYDDYNGKWRCPVCDSDKIVVLVYNINSKDYVERDLNNDADHRETQ